MGNHESAINIGAEFAQSLYADAKLVTNEIQPYFLLHKDTVRTFLHEKIDVLSNRCQFLGFIGIEISVLAALFTANFQDWHGFKGSTIEATFFISSVIFGGLAIFTGIKWLLSIKGSSVNALTDELGKRGVVIASTKGAATSNPTTGLPGKG
jgi:hypothetical protein